MSMSTSAAQLTVVSDAYGLHGSLSQCTLKYAEVHAWPYALCHSIFPLSTWRGPSIAHHLNGRLCTKDRRAQPTTELAQSRRQTITAQLLQACESTAPPVSLNNTHAEVLLARCSSYPRFQLSFTLLPLYPPNAGHPRASVPCKTDADDSFPDRAFTCALHMNTLRERKARTDIPALTAYMSRCVSIRARSTQVPVLFLSGMGNPLTRIYRLLRLLQGRH